MEAVISGQAGVALLVDGNRLFSIHVQALDEKVPRRAGEFYHLFGNATDLLFVENVEPECVEQQLEAATCGEDILHLVLLVLDPERPATHHSARCSR